MKLRFFFCLLIAPSLPFLALIINETAKGLAGGVAGDLARRIYSCFTMLLLGRQLSVHYRLYWPRSCIGRLTCALFEPTPLLAFHTIQF